jgi:putative MFS transporter
MGAGFFFAFFDIITIGLSLPVFSKQFNVPLSMALWTITSSLIGYIFGAFCDGRLSDFFGRRIALFLSVAAFSIGSLLSACSQNLETLIVCRFIIGLGIGAEISNVVTYVSELSPAKIRGRITAIPICIAFLGFAIVPFVGLLLVPNFSWGWRALFVIGGLGGLILFWMRRSMPESIRWLVAHDRLDEAASQLKQAESQIIKKIGKPLPPVERLNTEHSQQNLSLLTTIKANLKPLVLFAFIWFFYYLGNYAWLTLSTKLFMLAGFKLASSLLILGISSLGFVVGSLLAIFYGDRLERQHLAVFLASLWGLLLLFIAFWHTEISIIIFGFLATTAISFIIPIMYIFTSEQFATKTRATCLSITDGLGHLGGAFCGQYTFFFYDAFKDGGDGVNAAFVALAATGFITALLLTFGKKMTGSSLD